MSLHYSDFISNEENKKNISSIHRKKTQKAKDINRSQKIEQFLESIENDDEQIDMGDIPTNPEFSRNPVNQKTVQHMIQNHKNNITNATTSEHNDEEITQEAFDNLESSYAKNYYKKYVPYFTETNNSQQLHGSKDLLLEKLNYMIHLLEEQQEEKTGHVTEELILYSFLGVFIIFVVDSFARAGKYVR